MLDDRLAAGIGIAVDADADYGQAVAVLLLELFQPALNVRALIVPRGPRRDDVDGGFQIGLCDFLPFDASCREFGHFGTDGTANDCRQLFFQTNELSVVRVRLNHDIHQFAG